MTNLEQENNEESTNLGIYLKVHHHCNELKWLSTDIERLLNIADEVLAGIDYKNEDVQKIDTMLRSIERARAKICEHSRDILQAVSVECVGETNTPQPSKADDNATTASSTAATPIITQARRLAALEKEHNRLGEQLVFSNSGHISQVRSTYYNDRMNEIDYEIDAVKLIIPFTKATELEGAAIQLALLCHLTDSLVYEKGYEAHRKRLLYSIMDVIMQNVSLRPEDVAIDKLMPMHLNPWVGIDEIVAKVEASISHA